MELSDDDRWLVKAFNDAEARCVVRRAKPSNFFSQPTSFISPEDVSKEKTPYSYQVQQLYLGYLSTDNEKYRLGIVHTIDCIKDKYETLCKSRGIKSKNSVIVDNLIKARIFYECHMGKEGEGRLGTNHAHWLDQLVEIELATR